MLHSVLRKIWKCGCANVDKYLASICFCFYFVLFFSLVVSFFFFVFLFLFLFLFFFCLFVCLFFDGSGNFCLAHKPHISAPSSKWDNERYRSQLFSLSLSLYIYLSIYIYIYSWGHRQQSCTPESAAYGVMQNRSRRYLFTKEEIVDGFVTDKIAVWAESQQRSATEYEFGSVVITAGFTGAIISSLLTTQEIQEKRTVWIYHTKFFLSFVCFKLL